MLNNAGKMITVTVLVAIGLYACERQEGPAERAGKQMDKAADSVGQHVEKAGKNLQDAAKGDGK